ncbi:MAG: M56 family metallopeptidase [Myxococcota bacterium]
MSGVVAPGALDVAVGLALDVGWKVSVPLAIGLAASALPGTAAARHQRLALSLAAAPVVAAVVVAARGADAAWAVGAPTWPLWLWAAGAAVGLVELGWSLWALRALPTTRASGADALEVCSAVTGPMTAGWWRPRIFVPPDFDAWPAADRAAALAHERAHVRRGDWLVHVAARLLGAVLWFHPLAALARRRLALLAECAADDEVLAQGHDPVTYAELLLRLGRPGRVAALALGRSVVGVRVRRLLRGAGGPTASGRGAAALVVGCLAAATWCTADLAAWRAPAPIETCGPRAPFLPTYWSPTWSRPYSPSSN